MEFKKISIGTKHLMRIEQFKEMDYYGVEHFQFPIELMMENAGLQLANVISSHAKREDSILIGVGNGNNGGGGLVAARRLSAWGFNVHLDIWGDITKPLVRKQLDRAQRIGVSESSIDQPNVWVDAYLGFSQRFPLPEELVLRIKNANQSSALKVSLDIPVGFSVDNELNFFEADIILTLAAPKEELQKLGKSRVYVADLGIPHSVYKRFGKEILPFQVSNTFQVNKRLYIPEKVQKIRGSHGHSISSLVESAGLRAFIKTYANDLERDFSQKKDSVLFEVLNYYRPLMGKPREAVFAADLKKNDFQDISAAVHGFKASDQIPDVTIDFLFEKAVEMVLAGDFLVFRYY